MSGGTIFKVREHKCTWKNYTIFVI